MYGGPFLWRLSIVAIFCIATTDARTHAKDRYEKARHEMVRIEIASAGVNNSRVLDSMKSTLRHEFISKAHRKNAYFDMALPIGGGQTISPPYIVAFMTASLDPQPTDRVLEIGTGSGYQAAVLSPLVKDVYSIEIVESLGKNAARTLRRLGYKNVTTKVGDGYAGWSEHAPFDKIIVTCSPEKVPQPLIDQLVEGGKIVIPLGERFQQSLYLLTKKDGKLQQESLEATFFVPMTGHAESRRRVLKDETTPSIINGSFDETSEEDMALPAGWFYLRQASLQTGDGDSYLELINRTPGRSAHAMQAFGVDGEKNKKLTCTFRVSTDNVKHGQNKEQQACVIIEFYGKTRAPVGLIVLGPWSGTLNWKDVKKTIVVPPRAKLGVMGVGLFGATGTIRFDDVKVASSL